MMTVAVFTFLFLLLNVLKEMLPFLVRHHAPLGLVAEAIGLLIPFILVFSFPMALLTSVLLVFGRFSADQELTAARASGISLLSLTTPILLLSLGFCALSAVVNMEIAPRCRVAYINLLFGLKTEITGAELPEGHQIKDFKNYIFLIGRNRKGNMERVWVWRLDEKTQNVESTMYAPRGRLDNDTTNKQLYLILYDANFVRGNFEGAFGEVPIGPLDLNSSRQAARKPSVGNMTFTQLREELRELEQRMNLPIAVGESSTDELRKQKNDLQKQKKNTVTPLLVQMHRQVAFSFACFGFTLIGIPLGIRMHRRETNVGMAVALGLVAVYYSFILLGQGLASHPGWVPHLIVWIPNFIFQAVGSVLLWRANRGI